MYFVGDSAPTDEDGYVWVIGRVDDVINVSGAHVDRRGRGHDRLPRPGRGAAIVAQATGSGQCVART